MVYLEREGGERERERERDLDEAHHFEVLGNALKVRV